MCFNRKFYQENKENVEKVAEKLRAFYRDDEILKYQEMGSEIPADQVEQLATSAGELLESCAVYCVYQCSYDNRFGARLVVYAPQPKTKKWQKVKELLAKHFGECNYLGLKSSTKMFNYRVYNKNAQHFAFKDELDKDTRLNIIFNDTPVKDMKKYKKYMEKASKNVKY